MAEKRIRSGRFTALVVALAGALVFALPVARPEIARAFSESRIGPSSAPPLPRDSISVVPAEKAASRPRETKRSRSTHDFQVEPANARLRVKEAVWIFKRPSYKSAHIKRSTIGKYVVVTGSTRSYLRVHLKDGQIGYISQRAVDLVKPANKYFKLTHDTPVLNKPNRWGKKVAEVHRGYYVHVIGVALSYMQIKMKNGLVGFISVRALE